MLRPSKSSMYLSGGFSLVEIMVSLVIGMLATVVMLQVFALSEERKRATTGSGDVATNGVMNFYQLQRDIAQAGYGFASPKFNLFGCNTKWSLKSGSQIATAAPLVPAIINPDPTIVPAGDDNTDRLLIMYGNTDGQPQGTPVKSQAGNVYTMQSPDTFAVKDKVIAAATAFPCATNLSMDEITATSPTTVTAAVGATGLALYNFGPAPSILAYAIRGGNLTVCDYLVNDCGLAANTGDSTIWVPIGSNVVGMRAAYVHDGGGHDQITPVNNCDWAKVTAISLALVGRNSQIDKKVVTKTDQNAPEQVNAPTWADATVAPIIASTGALGPDAAADEPWKHYRYKVFQGILPIRNIAWMGAPDGC